MAEITLKVADMLDPAFAEALETRDNIALAEHIISYKDAYTLPAAGLEAIGVDLLARDLYVQQKGQIALLGSYHSAGIPIEQRVSDYLFGLWQDTMVITGTRSEQSPEERHALKRTRIQRLVIESPKALLNIIETFGTQSTADMPDPETLLNGIVKTQKNVSKHMRKVHKTIKTEQPVHVIKYVMERQAAVTNRTFDARIKMINARHGL